MLHRENHFSAGLLLETILPRFTQLQMQKNTLAIYSWIMHCQTWKKKPGSQTSPWIGAELSSIVKRLRKDAKVRKGENVDLALYPMMLDI